ncbi:MAG: ornithine cyclodeaminase [Rhodobacterales bacterium]|nr:MAG: ornithine cyclodeaminase [Rhodobacterales bacterium]
MNIEFIPYEAEILLDWGELADAIIAGHSLPRARIDDSFVYREPDTLLTRAAWVDGMGLAVKTATVFPENPADRVPAVNGAVNLYTDAHGVLEAIVDFHLVTKWKTAATSLVAARLLAPEDPESILIVGAGRMAKAMRAAYGWLYPGARFLVWNRSPAGAEDIAAHFPDTLVVTDLESAVRSADIVSTATMSRQPLIEGDWLAPGQHVDLIGAYRADMREADDRALQRGRIFVDSRETVLGHIGELAIPLEAGTVTKADVLGDFYDIGAGAFRRAPEDITLFKNGGGAHLDLMTARYILGKWRAR